MNLYYKIVEVHPEQHSIVVRFYTDVVSERSLAVQTGERGNILRARTDLSIDLPYPVPIGDELAQYILARAPAQWLRTQEAVQDPEIDTSMADLLPLIGKAKTGAIAPKEAVPLVLGEKVV